MLLLQPWPGLVLGASRRGSHRVVKAGVHCGRRSTQTLGPMGPHRHKQRLLHGRKLRPRETQTTRPRSSSYHRGAASRMAAELCSQPPPGLPLLGWETQGEAGEKLTGMDAPEEVATGARPTRGWDGARGGRGKEP